MRSFLELLIEAKQVGTLYHYTNNDILKTILKTNTLKAQFDTISTTRDKNFMNYGRIGIKRIGCRIELDGNKLSHKYKVKPYNYFSDFYSNAEPYRHKKSQDEQEEIILAKEVPNISDYINKITLYEFMEPSDELISIVKESGIPYEIVK